MKKNIFLLFFLVSGLFVVASCTDKPLEEVSNTKATIFMSSSCECCEIYSQYMKKQGFDVDVVKREDMSSIKSKYNIPSNMESCHTTVIGNYFIEGHVPVEAVEKLLTENPDIAGIALPNMPSGSPGMPGAKQGQFVVYALNKDGASSEFMRI